METSNLHKSIPVSALFDPKIVLPAIGSAFVKFNPRTLIRKPVMFVLEIVTALTTLILVRDLVIGEEHIGFEFQIILWLWLTVLFANFSEAIAEGRGKAQAELAAPAAHRDPGEAVERIGPSELQARALYQPRDRRRRSRRSRRHDTLGRRSDRGYGLGQRSRNYR